MNMQNKIDPRIKTVNSSGFPLQLAIQNEIETELRGWSILSREHPWRHDESGANGFIDLIVKKNSCRLVIECKRVRDVSWTFLCPNNSNLNRSHAKAWMTKVSGGEDNNFLWHDLEVNPISPETEFCAILGQDNKKTLLESIGSELSMATEALASEEYYLYKGMNEPNFLLFYFPVIVTTAELHVCKFNPENISLDNGEIINPDFETVPLVRFRKSLSNNSYDRVRPAFYKNIKDIAKDKERTVSVINASCIKAVLEQWEVS